MSQPTQKGKETISQQSYRKMVEKFAEIKNISVEEAAQIIIDSVKQFYEERGLKY